MRELLKNIYGHRLEAYQERTVNLPLYLMSNRKFYDVTLCGTKFVLVCFQEPERFQAAAFKKQLRKYSDSFQTDVAFGFWKVTALQRKALIENDIAFVAENEQLFLPFTGACFRKCIRQQKDLEIQRLMPASQMLYLLLLYSRDGERYSRSKAAELLSLTAMSVTRAADQLKKLGILSEKKIGTEILMYLCTDKRESFERMTPYLINPIQEVCYADARMWNGGVRAGEDSLAGRSDYGYPRCREFAIYKANSLCRDFEELNPQLEVDREMIRIQKWKYDPGRFCVGQDVDPVSLICSFQGEEDERIHKCLEQVAGEITKWQIILN